MKSMKKTALALLAVCTLILCTVFGAANVSAAETLGSGEFGDGLHWYLYDTGKLVIDGEGDMPAWESMNDVPWFSLRKQITSVAIGESVTSIGDYAFFEAALNSAYISDSVTTIGQKAFFRCTALHTLRMGNSVESIDTSAFMNCAFTEITLPETLTSVGECAFWNCPLTTVSVLSRDADFGVDVFGGEIFYSTIDDFTLYCYMESTAATYANNFDLPLAFLDGEMPTETVAPETNAPEITGPVSGTFANNLTWSFADGQLTISGKGEIPFISESERPWNSFKDSITSLTVESGITSIGAFAFDSCINLTSVSLPDTLTAIGWFAFQQCVSLPDIEIPAGVTSIGDGAFNGCHSLARVDIPSGVTSIGQMAFYQCYALETITLPDTVSSIGDGAFGQGGLETVIVDAANPYFCVGDSGVLFNKDMTTLFFYPAPNTSAHYTVPNTVTTICGMAFSNAQFESITIPEGVVSIGQGAFEHCRNLTSVTIPGTVAEIAPRTFASCTNLSDVTISEGVLAIYDSVFANCEALTSITIPESVEFIDERAFGWCTSLISATILSANVEFGYNVFTECSANLILFGYEGSTTEAYADDNNIRFAIIGTEAPETSTPATPGEIIASGECGDGLGWELGSNGELLIQGEGPMTNWSAPHETPWYEYMEDITSVTIAEGVTTVGDYAFDCFEGIKSITLADTVTYIGFASFEMCRLVTELNIPASVKTISDWAFNGLESLTSLNIPHGVTYIGEWAFAQNYSLTQVTIPASVTEIGAGAFATCHSLTGITVDENNPNYCSVNGVLFNKDMTTLCQYPAGIRSSVYGIPNGVVTVLAESFAGSLYLSSVTIPNTVEYIEYYAFSECFTLQNIAIPESVSYIDPGAFQHCENLSTFVVAENNPYYTAEDGVLFNKGKTILHLYLGSKKDASYTIPSTVTFIDNNAFAHNMYITSVTIPESVTEIGGWAFFYCESLTEVTLPASVATIGDRAFASCESLESATVMNPEAEFGWRVFNHAPEAFTLYGYEGSTAEAYAEEEALTFVALEGEAPEIPTTVIASGECGDSLTWELNNKGEITVSGTGAMWNWSYNELAPWYEYNPSIKTVALPEGITTIGDYAFNNCEKLTSINIPNGVTTIGSNAFTSTKLTSIAIPASVSAINGTPFFGCNKLESITVDENNPYYCSNNGVLFNKSKTVLLRYPAGNRTASYTVPDSVVEIRENAFHRSCLTTVTLPDSLVNLNALSFQNCDNLTEITIPASVAEIGWYAFYSCDNLTSVTVLGMNTHFDEETFASDATVTIHGYEGSTAEAYATEHGFTFETLEAPETEPMPQYVLGDINGDGNVDIKDALKLFQHSMSSETYPITYPGYIDYTKDGNLDITDALRLFQYSMSPETYPLDGEGVHADFFRRLVGSLDFEGVNSFSIADRLSVNTIVDFAYRYAEQYDIDFTPYRTYPYPDSDQSWIYIDIIPASVMNTLIMRMWGITVDLSAYDGYTADYFGYDEATETFRYSNVGGRGGGYTHHYFDSYTAHNGKFTVLVKYYTHQFEMPDFGVEGEDWYMENMYDEDVYFIYQGMKKLTATLVDGYIQINSYTYAN